MSKKNVALIVIIICFLTIMLVAVLGNAAVTGVFTNVSSVEFYDNTGEKINIKYYSGSDEVKEVYDELDNPYYVFAKNEVALDEEQVSKLTIKYYIRKTYTQGDLVTIDGVRYIYFELFAIVNPGEASYPALQDKLIPHMPDFVEQKIVNLTQTQDGKEEGFVSVTLGTDDGNKALIPFAAKLEEQLEEGATRIVTFTKYGLYVSFTELGEYNPDATPDEDDSYRNAILKACDTRDGSFDIDFEISPENTLVINIPEIAFVIEYVKTAEEISATSEDISQ